MRRGRVEVTPVLDTNQVRDPGREPRAGVESDEGAQERLVAVHTADLFGRHRLQRRVDVVFQPRHPVAGVGDFVRRPRLALAPADLVERIEAELRQRSPLEVALRAADDGAVRQNAGVAPRALGERDLQLAIVVDQPSHAGNRPVGRDGDTLMRHEVWIVGPAERARVRGPELRQMQAVEDVPPGRNPIGFRFQLRRFNQRLGTLFPHPVAIPGRLATLEIDRIGADFVDRRGVVPRLLYRTSARP